MHEPSIESVIERLEGWTGRKSAKANSEYDEHAERIYRIFGHGEGKEILELILEMTIRRPIGGFDVPQLAMREGQNSVALAILEYFKRGKVLSDERYRNSSTNRSEPNSERATSNATSGFAAIR